MDFIAAVVEKAIPLCLARPRYSTSTLPHIIEITLLNDRAIAKVHATFLQDPTPTDVITFSHSQDLGEILIGIPTVATHAKNFNQPLEHEIARCVIHGFLHLLDYDDRNSEDYRLMHDCQETILKKALL